LPIQAFFDTSIYIYLCRLRLVCWPVEHLQLTLLKLYLKASLKILNNSPAKINAEQFNTDRHSDIYISLLVGFYTIAILTDIFTVPILKSTSRHLSWLKPILNKVSTELHMPSCYLLGHKFVKQLASN